MLTIIRKAIYYSMRKVKVNKVATEVPKPQKIKFTEEELTEMSTYDRKNKRSINEIYSEKYQKQQEIPEEEYETERTHHKESKDNLHEKMMKFKVHQLRNRMARVSEEELTAEEKARIRLDPQYLPMQYLLKVQKIFHKYDQKQLRDIAGYFTDLMKLRYREEKIDYDLYGELKFQKLEERIPTNKKDKKYINPRKVDEDPIDESINYTQNVVVSYLLNRVPRTFAVAVRVLTEIKYKYPSFQPESIVDFGAGLSSGSCAFVDIFGDTGRVYSVDPASKMRKLSKYLTEYANIQHFETLGSLSAEVSYVDIVYCGYVLSEIRAELIEVYLEALYAKIKPEGFLVIIEYGNPYGARVIHEIRKWALHNTNSSIAGPCPHHNKCPLSNSMQWCHFDQPAGMYPKQVFGKLPTDNDVKLEKFSYIVLQKHLESPSDLNPENVKVSPNITHEWDRIMFPIMKRGKHIILNLCTVTGKYERRVVAKSHGEEYKEGRKLKWGDLWRFGKRIPNRYRKERKTGKRLW